MVHGHTTYALRLVSSVRLERDPAQPVWLLSLVAVLGFGTGHPTFGALMAVLFVVALLRVGRTIIIGVPSLQPSHIGRPVMATVAPFHSSQNPGVYHTCSNCTEGKNIERQNRKPGTGGATCATTAGDFLHKLAVSDR